MKKKNKPEPAPVPARMHGKPLKLYLVKHPAHGETTVNGTTKYEAALAAAKKWRERWTVLAREAEFIVLAVDD